MGREELQNWVLFCICWAIVLFFSGAYFFGEKILYVVYFAIAILMVYVMIIWPLMQVFK
jgi:hypothetical protein